MIACRLIWVLDNMHVLVCVSILIMMVWSVTLLQWLTPLLSFLFYLFSFFPDHIYYNQTGALVQPRSTLWTTPFQLADGVFVFCYAYLSFSAKEKKRQMMSFFGTEAFLTCFPLLSWPFQERLRSDSVCVGGISPIIRCAEALRGIGQDEPLLISRLGWL